MRARGSSEPAREADLLGRARGGDRDAFRDLVEAHLPQVWRVAWRVLRDRQDAEDVAQEVFLAAWQALPDFRGESSVATWLHRIAVNRALNHRALAGERGRRAWVALDPVGDPEADDAGSPARVLPDPSPTPLQALEEKELRGHLADCLRRLPAAWRVALALREGESLSYEAIAAALDVAVGTVRSRLARARLGLRRCVEGGAP